MEISISQLKLTKKSVQDALNSLNEPFTFSEFIEHILLSEEIKSGLKDIEEGNFISHGEMKIEIDSWFQ